MTQNDTPEEVLLDKNSADHFDRFNLDKPNSKQNLRQYSKDGKIPVSFSLSAWVTAVMLMIWVQFAYLWVYMLVTGKNRKESIEAFGETFSFLLFSLISPQVFFIVAVVIFAIAKKNSFIKLVGLKFKREDILRGIGFGILAQVAIGILYTPLQWINPELAKTISDPAESLSSPVHGLLWIPFSFLVAVVAPFGEEIFFRGLLLRSFLQKWGQAVAIFVSGFIFGITHLETVQAPALILLGCFLGWRATKTGRIGEPIFIHATFNGLTLITLAAS